MKFNTESSKLQNRRKYLLFALFFVVCWTLQAVSLPPKAIAEVAPPITTSPYTSGSGTKGFVVTVIGSGAGVDLSKSQVLFTNNEALIEEYIGFFVGTDSLGNKQIIFANGEGEYLVKLVDSLGNEILQLPLPTPPPIN